MITLLIPTINRSDFIHRLLQYYHGQNFRGTIAIGDSSNPFHADKNKETISRMEATLDITYSEFPGKSDSQVVKELLQSTTTEFSAFLPDDDFLIPDSLYNCAQFLHCNSDYAAAHGVGLILELDSNNARGNITAIRKYDQPILEQSTAETRLTNLLSNYSVSIFSVHRTASLTMMYSYLSDDFTDRSLSGELLQCCLSAISGKTKELDSLYLIRQSHTQNYPDQFNWLTKPDWATSYSLFTNALCEQLQYHDQISQKKAMHIVTRSFWGYLLASLNQDFDEHFTPKKLNTIRSSIKSRPLLYNMIKRLLCISPSRWNNVTVKKLLEKSSKYKSHFKPVYDVLTDTNLTSVTKETPNPNYPSEK